MKDIRRHMKIHTGQIRDMDRLLKSTLPERYYQLVDENYLETDGEQKQTDKKTSR